MRLGVGKSSYQRFHGTDWAHPDLSDDHYESRKRNGVKFEIGFNGRNDAGSLGYNFTLGYDSKHMSQRRLYQNNNLDRLMGSIGESAFARGTVTYSF